jgi:hypothetical protein
MSYKNKEGIMKKILLWVMCMAFLWNIVSSQTITVTNPAGGEVWYKGVGYTITWTKDLGPSGSMDPNVKIKLLNPDANLNIAMTMSTPNDGSFDWTIPGTIPDGNYTVRVKTTDDAYSDDSEVFRIEKRPMPEISKIDKNISAAPPHPLPDFEAYGEQLGYIGCDTVKYHIAVKNKGNEDADVVPVRLKITGPPGSPYSNYTINENLPCPLPQNMSCSWEKTFTIKHYGLYHFLFTVNPNNTPLESRRNNNVVDDMIDIQKPDLTVWISPSPVAYLTMKTNVVFYVKNQGRGCAAASVLRTYLQEKGADLHSIPVLRMNEIYKVTRSETWYKLGTKTITGIADYTPEKVDETNENNNSYQTSLKVKAMTTSFDQSGLEPPPPGFFENARVINK